MKGIEAVESRLTVVPGLDRADHEVAADLYKSGVPYKKQVQAAGGVGKKKSSAEPFDVSRSRVIPSH